MVLHHEPDRTYRNKYYAHDCTMGTQDTFPSLYHSSLTGCVLNPTRAKLCRQIFGAVIGRSGPILACSRDAHKQTPLLYGDPLQ